MYQHNTELPLLIVFPPQEWPTSLPSDFLQTGKHAHVTFFFNEERHMIPKSRDLRQTIRSKVASVILGSKHEFVLCNFAPPDMAGHTGV
ncbi:hypothetical protein BT96DRAFT_1023919 [Gymnopus androsaceus JB14]|uniref:Metalloenzyme domain-containing protein n=1 Tax=Gymnopus androsaceus JB14 TaxID=1447944 RepID=A0A6A4H0M1_9AGAR|nr:hypothetical protein BT96DRAFT_1023919 [Gymnopus androsaceus JB14]